MLCSSVSSLIRLSLQSSENLTAVNCVTNLSGFREAGLVICAPEADPGKGKRGQTFQGEAY